MTKDEALRMALEALEETRNALAWFYDSYPQDITKKGNELLPHVETVLTTLREALAEPAVQGEPVRREQRMFMDEQEFYTTPQPDVPDGRKLVPVEPSPGLLMSMAIRYDHGLGMPGFYDSPIYQKHGGASHQQRLEAALSIARQMYEEASLQGFYSPAKEQDYADMLAAALQQGETK